MKVTRWQVVASICAGAVSVLSFAQAPLGATGQCNDGSYSMMDSKQGACGKHGGVKQWYENNRAPDKSVNALSSQPTKTSAAGSAPPALAGKATPAVAGRRESAKAYASSRRDHCEKAHGKTAKDEDPAEAHAKATADHLAHGKACS